MTYCIAASVNAGLVFCSDSRTSAGLDQVSTYSKMFQYNLSPERQFVILSAGNLATSQAALAQVNQDLKLGAPVNLGTVATMGDAADYLGGISKMQKQKYGADNPDLEASFIVGGQIAGNPHQAMMIYPEGNHITVSRDTPYLQLGESKYGKPILDRIIEEDTSLETAALCALVSMDSTMRSNLAVGPPIEMLIYSANAFSLQNYYRFEEGDEYLRELKKSWHNGLRGAFNDLPPLAWSANWNKVADGS